MKEDNQPVKDQSHLSKIEMFPKGRSEYQKPQLSHEIRQTAPLTENTVEALADVANRQYRVTAYMDDYLDPRDRDRDGNLIVTKSNKEEEENEKSKLYKPKENLRENEIQGGWPSWPASINKTICKQTGRVMEKADVASADDKIDHRRLRFLTKKSDGEKNQYNVAERKKPFNTSSDLVPMSNFYLCGCGPYTTGIRNIRKDLDTTAYNEKAAIAADVARSAAIDEPLRHLRGDDTLIFDKNRHPYKPTDHREKYNDFQRDIGDRWRNHLIHTQVPDYFLNSKQGFSLSTAEDRGEPIYSRRGPELFLEDFEYEGKRESEGGRGYDGDPIRESRAQHPETGYSITRSGTLPPDFSGPSTVVPSLINPADWLDHLKRREKKYSAMIDSAAPNQMFQDDILNKMEKQRMASAQNIENYAAEKGLYTAHLHPNTLYYTPEIKVSKNRMLEAEQCEGVGNSLRHWLPFKSVSSKRIQFTNPEPMPDWRDTQRKLKKEMYLGYHSRIFV